MNIYTLLCAGGDAAAKCGGMVNDLGDERKRDEDREDCKGTWNQQDFLIIVHVRTHIMGKMGPYRSLYIHVAYRTD
jgi:hypothetical protein